MGVVRVWLLVLAASVLLALPAPAAGDVPPGFDLFETDPEATVFSFREEFTIPPNFFDTGSEPFQGDVNFAGRPLGTFQQRDVGDADTVVQRPQQATLPPSGQGGSDIIPIDLVALNLVSVQPIRVGMQQGPDRFFDIFVEISEARSSQGEMRILQQSSAGGMFDSRLQVFPRFTFVPLDGGSSRTLDTGMGQPSPRLILGTDGGVWRAGCVPPALSVPALNPGFCPGLTPGGRKRLTVEASALARHGVYPAQPALEHFQCYRVGARRVRSRTLTLRDQFGRRKAKLRRRGDLCNPVRKGRERFRNRRAHLQCYTLGRRRRSKLVAVRNQFGSHRLRTRFSEGLCVPSRKFRRRAPRRVTFTDHFLCYRVRRIPFRTRTVRLRDQFGRARVRVRRPFLLCNPVQKNRQRINHPVQHLVCYTITRRKVRRRPVRVRNQFGRNQRIRVRSRRSLCVPSVKIEL
jgi:hypothetical protein